MTNKAYIQEFYQNIKIEECFILQAKVLKIVNYYGYES